MHGLSSSRGDGALTSSRAPAAVRGRILLLGVVALAVVVLDQAIKELALATLEPGRFVGLFGERVGWQLIFNPGAAFGLRFPPVVFPIVTAVLIVVVLRTLRDPSSVPSPTTAVVAQGLVIGGALGNVIDRIMRPGDDVLFGGHVVDFVAWGGFPRFNIADASITVGVAVFVLVALREDLAERRRTANGGSVQDS